VRGDARFDACARRVLPGHLLRRCRVLSSLPVGGGRHLQRVALVAHSGEEALVEVELWDEEQQQQEGKSGSSTTTTTLPPSLRGWRLARMTRDASGDEAALTPSTSRARSNGRNSSATTTTATIPASVPRPAARVGPEAAVLAQISRLAQGDVEGASRWCSWARRLGSGPAWEAGLRQFRETLRRPEHFALLTSAAAEEEVSLGQGALPSQRRLLQTVRLGREGDGAASREFLWEMSMQDDGVWLVRSIVAVG